MSEIFLSYARVDDETPNVAAQHPGWVRYFHETVYAELRQRLDKDLRFWRDVHDLEPDSTFARDIEDALARAKLMVSVVSPNYLHRPWCLREIELFVALQAGDDNDRNERILKILKHDVPENAMPPPLRNRGRGYRFFCVDPLTNHEQPFYMAGRLLPRFEQQYFDMINEIVERIAKRLRASMARPTNASGTGPAVFVAQPPQRSRLHESYLALTAELTHQGFNVTPTPREPFPDTLDEAKTRLNEATEQACLLIHLVGETGGKIPDGATESMTALQLRLTADLLASRSDLRRLIWTPGRAQSTNTQHEQLLEALHRCSGETGHVRPETDEIVTGAYDSFLGLGSVLNRL